MIAFRLQLRAEDEDAATAVLWEMGTTGIEVRPEPLGRVLDIGTGTCILAVAAALVGARNVTGVEIDPDSLDVARLHAHLNRVPLRLVRGDGGRPFAPASFDLIVANLTAPLLAERRDEIGALRTLRAPLILSGVLTEELPAIRAAYGPLGSLAVPTEGEWAAVVVGRAGVP